VARAYQGIVEDCARFDVNRAVRALGPARPARATLAHGGPGWRAFTATLALAGPEPAAVLDWRSGDDGAGEARSQRVALATIAGPAGFRRWAIVCGGCGRRVGAAYRPQAAEAWLCRHCHALTYLSKRPGELALRRAADAAMREFFAGMPRRLARKLGALR
jgi:hypothetical protein